MDHRSWEKGPPHRRRTSRTSETAGSIAKEPATGVRGAPKGGCGRGPKAYPEGRCG